MLSVLWSIVTNWREAEVVLQQYLRGVIILMKNWTLLCLDLQFRIKALKNEKPMYLLQDLLLAAQPTHDCLRPIFFLIFLISIFMSYIGMTGLKQFFGQAPPVVTMCRYILFIYLFIKYCGHIVQAGRAIKWYNTEHVWKKSWKEQRKQNNITEIESICPAKRYKTNQ